jgi:hypothetical protein
MKSAILATLVALLLGTATLNAQTVGYSAMSLTNISFGTTPVVILQTVPVSATGTYYVNATAYAGFTNGAGDFNCYFAPVSTGQSDGNSVTGGYQTEVALVDAVNVNAGDSIGFYCVNSGPSIDLVGVVNPAAMTAIFINTPSAAKTKGKKK